MRCAALTFLLFFTSLLAAAQEEDGYSHSFRLGINAAFIASGDMMGLANYAEYGYSFNERIAIAPRIMSVTADQEFGYQAYHVSILGGSVAARFTPFPDLYRGLKLDLGGTYQRVKTTDTRSEPITGSAWRITNNVLNEREHYFGAIGSLSFGILQGERLGAGLRLEMITSFKDRSINSEMLQSGIFLSVRF